MKQKVWMLLCIWLMAMPLAAQQTDVKQLEKAAKKGDAQAQLELGYELLFGKADGRNETQGFQWVQKAVENGHKVAVWLLGRCYERGIGTTTDEQKALDLYEKAAADSLSLAYKSLAYVYLYGNKTVPRDTHKGADYLQRAAEEGSEDAMRELAGCYLNGIGVQPDKEKAMLWLDYMKQVGDKKYAESIIKDVQQGDSLGRYVFEFRLLPRLWRDITDGFLSKYIVENTENLRTALALEPYMNYGFDYSKLSIERIALDDRRDIILLTMPEPKSIPDCKYIALVDYKGQRRYGYFTLEKSMNNLWFLCGVGRGLEHLNYGGFKKAVTKENFITSVKTHTPGEDVQAGISVNIKQ